MRRISELVEKPLVSQEGQLVTNPDTQENKEAVGAFKTSVSTYKTTRYQNPEDYNLINSSRGN